MRRAWPPRFSELHETATYVDHLRVFVDKAGTRYARKATSEDESATEEAASKIARRMGFRVPRVIVSPENGYTTFQEVVENAVELTEALADRRAAGKPQWKASWLRDLARASVADFVLSDMDRHGRNFMVVKDRRIVAIDRGYAFGRYGGLAHNTNPELWHKYEAQGPYSEQLVAAQRPTLLNAVRPADLTVVLDRLDSIPDSEYADMLPAHTAVDRRALVKRKRSARAGYSRMFTKLVKGRIKTAPAVWQAWLTAGGTF